METKAPTSLKRVNMLLPLIILLGTLVIVDFVFLFLFRSQITTVKLLKTEAQQLDTDRRIITASADIESEYKKEINAISGVFPTEETIPLFIQSLESAIRTFTEDYTFKFASLHPVAEQDKLFLLVTVSMRCEFVYLISFLEKLEVMPYMTHVVNIQAKTPENITGKSDISVALKVYVQNPFTTK